MLNKGVTAMGEILARICERCDGKKEIPVEDEYGYIWDEICPDCNGWGYVKREVTRQDEPE